MNDNTGSNDYRERKFNEDDEIGDSNDDHVRQYNFTKTTVDRNAIYPGWRPVQHELNKISDTNNTKLDVTREETKVISTTIPTAVPVHSVSGKKERYEGEASAVLFHPEETGEADEHWSKRRDERRQQEQVASKYQYIVTMYACVCVCVCVRTWIRECTLDHLKN